MPQTTIYEALAECFADEGVTTLYALLGDGNMHWATILQDRHNVRLIHVRHEHNAVGAAMGHSSATGEVGVATVTCGPGFTQIMTALTSASRGRVPLVVFAGEAPLTAKYSHQRIDQAPFAVACGAHYIAAHSPTRMHDYVRSAFYIARTERRPVVVGVPYDLQKKPIPELGRYRPSTLFIAPESVSRPEPAELEAVAGLLREAKRPIVLAGRGVMQADAADDVEELAELSGALLATTLPARGLFDHNPYSLGVCGGYARPATMPVYAASDLVVAFGASLSYYTQNGGRMFPDATVVKIGLDDSGMSDGLASGSRQLRADAKLAARGLISLLCATPPPPKSFRNAERARGWHDAPIADSAYQIAPGTLDPIRVFEELEATIPKDFEVVSGTGHQSFFHTTMRGYDPARYHHMRAFGAVGNSLSHALGIAAARDNGRVVLFEGDGSLLMYVQELETIRRHGIKLLIVCCNDGAYGAEIHKLRADGLPDRNAVFGRTDLASIARGFGLRSATVTEPAQFGRLLDEYEAFEDAMIWDVHISDQVVSPSMRRSIELEHETRR